MNSIPPTVRTLVSTASPTDTHTTDSVPTFEDRRSISAANVAIIASCLSMIVFIILGMWYLHMRGRGAPSHSGLRIEPDGNTFIKPTSLWSLMQSKLRPWSWTRLREKISRTRVRTRANENQRAIRYCEPAPTLYSVKITHPEIDLEKALEGVDVDTAKKAKYAPLDTPRNDEIGEIDGCDTDSNWTLGEEWRYIHPHPGRRII